jgi:hypothetical protein
MADFLETAMDKAKDDGMRQMCIQQGYVPPRCQLNGVIVFALVSSYECPCWGCNMDRTVCGGKPKGGRYVEEGSGNVPNEVRKI